MIEKYLFELINTLFRLKALEIFIKNIILGSLKQHTVCGKDTI